MQGLPLGMSQTNRADVVDSAKAARSSGPKGVGTCRQAGGCTTSLLTGGLRLPSVPRATAVTLYVWLDLRPVSRVEVALAAWGRWGATHCG